MDLFKAMKERKSARAYTEKQVSRADIEEIISYAGMAPSAINLQPWEFVVTYGEEKDRLVRRLKKVHAERNATCGPGTSRPLPQRFSDRSKKAMLDMEPSIKRLGIEFNRFIEQGSCSFYGAPVAIIVTIDKIFPVIRYLDIGLSVSYLFLAAEAKGISTCPIGLIIQYADEIAEALNIPEDKEILLAIAMGYRDGESYANEFKSSREGLKEILTWYE